MSRPERQRIDAKIKRAIRAYRRRFQSTNCLHDNLFYTGGALCVRIRDDATGRLAEYDISQDQITFMPTH